MKTSFRHNVEALVERAAFRFLGIDELLAVCKGLPSGPPETFAPNLLQAMEVTTDWSGLPLDAIPAKGPLIVVANHPFGLIEGLALDTRLLTRRQDVKAIMLNSIAELPGIGQRHILVDPLRGKGSGGMNANAWRQAIRWLHQGGVLAVFPAGRVARFDWSRRAVADPRWNPHIARVARRSGAPVLPVYFDGRNSVGFQIASVLLPTLHQSLVAREVNNKRGRTLRGIFGDMVQPDRISALASDQEIIDFLRAKVESLAGSASRG